MIRDERRLRIFENRIPRQIFLPKGGGNGDYKIIEYSVSRSPNILKMVKPIKMWCAGHVVRTRAGRSAFKTYRYR